MPAAAAAKRTRPGSWASSPPTIRRSRSPPASSAPNSSATTSPRRSSATSPKRSWRAKRAEIPAGTVFDGRYRIVQRIGGGGMADVYLAEDTHLQRRVALKVLHKRFAQDREFVERFRREAESAAKLAHPNIVAVYDRGEFEGTYYIAMQYI